MQKSNPKDEDTRVPVCEVAAREERKIATGRRERPPAALRRLL
jgi:hypothetical protein